MLASRASRASWRSSLAWCWRWGAALFPDAREKGRFSERGYPPPLPPPRPPVHSLPTMLAPGRRGSPRAGWASTPPHPSWAVRTLPATSDTCAAGSQAGGDRAGGATEGEDDKRALLQNSDPDISKRRRPSPVQEREEWEREVEERARASLGTGREESRGGGNCVQDKTSQCLSILDVGRDFRNLVIWSSPHYLPPMGKLRSRKVNFGFCGSQVTQG